MGYAKQKLPIGHSSESENLPNSRNCMLASLDIVWQYEALMANDYIADLNDPFWDQLLLRMQIQNVIPVVGPGAIAFGREENLYIRGLLRKSPKNAISS